MLEREQNLKLVSLKKSKLDINKTMPDINKTKGNINKTMLFGSYSPKSPRIAFRVE